MNQLTQQQVLNLKRLAKYLKSLPEDYKHFDINDYTTTNRDFFVGNLEPSEVTETKITACGSSACGIGHGPLIGLNARKGESWAEYGKRVFGADIRMEGYRSSLWYRVFSAHWTGPHNHHYALVQRLVAWLHDNGYMQEDII